MVTCPRCGQENPEGFRFCGACAAPLTEEASATREERKVVTVLFCDLVGSTEQAERMDPEDVRALLSRYHERVRHELERFGGTVEKFIGDAVMALFGAPVAHEDDPERAVRAAHAIREWAAEDGELQVRIGITTGEALVALGARLDHGEGMASGDVVNTAARLQSAAPENGILVDETTFRATERAIAYDEQRPIQAKGKAAPVSVWLAVEPKARFGVDVRQIGRTPLVGREDELEALVAVLDRARREREPQLVTLVGVPGIGKSRLVWELFQRLEQGPELIRWRQGRSRPYGEGVSFWALGEMVKAQAGILETDDAARTHEKLHETVAALVSDSAEAQWLERHLRPLVGLETGGEAGGDRRGEAFAAWRRFFETLAEQRPLVLVFEDLHFADDDLLDFVDHLVDWASGVPLLVVGTARPELLARRPDWGGGKPHALTLSLSPLSHDQTAQLVHGLLERPVLDAAVREALLERAAGNPLYAEEFVRMVEEHDPAEELPLPETVQGLIAARIDGLTPEEKAILQDAAVLGKVFWLGAVAALAAAERWVAGERLHALERKEFVRRERRSSVAGETEYAFRHLLVRDVAYGQIPRQQRAEKHRQAAAWIASLARPEDQAEMVAHHFLSALELLRAAGQPTEEIAEQAGSALRHAGDRAFALNAFAHAAYLYEQSVELWRRVDSTQPELLFRWAHALHLAADERQLEAFEIARDALIDAGDRDRAAEAQVLLARAWWYRGTWERARSAYERAMALLDDGPPTAARAHVLAQVSSFRGLDGEYEEAIRVAGEALVAADALGLDEVRAAALTTRGFSRMDAGDDAGIGDLEQSRDVALGAGALPEAARACNNLGVVLYGAGELARSFGLLEEALALAERAGHVDLMRFGRGMMMLPALDGGRWDDCVRLADAFIAECEAGAPHTLQASVHCHRGSIRLARDDLEGAVGDAERALELARDVQQPDRVFQSLGFAVRALAASGALERARALASEFDFLTLGGRRPPPSWSSIHFAWAATDVGSADELDRLLAGQKRQTAWVVVTRMVLSGDYVAAAELFGQMPTLPHEAYARLRAAQKLVAEGRDIEGDEQLDRAVDFFRSVGATRYLREAEAIRSARVEGPTSVGQ
jgi:class 3 adenylate cyclase/tetratricopeptide (TPR) repeat protein